MINLFGEKMIDKFIIGNANLVIRYIDKVLRKNNMATVCARPIVEAIKIRLPEEAERLKAFAIQLPPPQTL